MIDQPNKPSSIYKALVIIAGTALLAAMCIDVVAVTGRAIRLPLLGSIELVQVVVGISGALSMLVATLHGRHAKVLILFSRFGPRTAGWVGRINALLSTLFFLALLVGSLWLVADLWQGQEESELWHLPYKPLRMLICAALALVSSLFLWQTFRGQPGNPDSGKDQA